MNEATRASISEIAEEPGRDDNTMDVSTDGLQNTTEIAATELESDLYASPYENELKGRSSRLRFDAEAIRSMKPSPKEVLVIALGSQYIRYGNANSSVPRKMRNITAFERTSVEATTENALHCKQSDGVPSYTSNGISASTSEHMKEFDSVVSEIASVTRLSERRRGGGKPIPWSVEVEPVNVDDVPEEVLASDTVRPSGCGKAVYVGRAAERISQDEGQRNKFHFISPISEGRMAWNSQYSTSFVRSALDAVLVSIARQFRESLMNQTTDSTSCTDEDPSIQRDSQGNPMQLDASTHIALIVPETSDRADVAEFIEALFRVDELRTGAVFAHHSSVSCALGAGLSTCVVIDIGYSGSTIACVEEGCVLGDSRLHLQYGSRTIAAVFDTLLRKNSQFDKVCADVLGERRHQPRSRKDNASSPEIYRNELYPGDTQAISLKACEQLCGFNVDENDTLAIAMVRAPRSGKMVRVKCGVGIRALPAYGMLYPVLFEAVSRLQGFPLSRLSIPSGERNSAEDNFMIGLFDDVKRSAMVSAAVPFGRFANEFDGNAEATDSGVHQWRAPLIEALIWSVNRAVETSVLAQTDSVRGPELKRRYFKSILLAGGGASLTGIAPALETRLKMALEEMHIVVNDVTIIDGGKGKGDEDLLAAAALLRSDGVTGLDNGDDPASLAWKGGAVMVEADSVKELWVYRDEWISRNVRALRERVPFYW